MARIVNPGGKRSTAINDEAADRIGADEIEIHFGPVSDDDRRVVIEDRVGQGKNALIDHGRSGVAIGTGECHCPRTVLGDGSTGIPGLGDGSADFTKATGLTLDLTARGMGLRSNRYSMLIKDGKVATLNVEGPGKFEVSDAQTMLAQAKA